MQIEIRNLTEGDARTSYMWRNNPLIWKYTGARPDREVTLEMETKWIKDVLQRSNEKRFAIIVDDVYVGNTYLTSIENGEAEFHIFIGETAYWHKGIATSVLAQVLKYAKDTLKLEKVVLGVNSNNVCAVKLYENAGFEKCGKDGLMVLMEKIL